MMKIQDGSAELQVRPKPCFFFVPATVVSFAITTVIQAEYIYNLAMKSFNGINMIN